MRFVNYFKDYDYGDVLYWNNEELLYTGIWNTCCMCGYHTPFVDTKSGNYCCSEECLSNLIVQTTI